MYTPGRPLAKFCPLPVAPTTMVVPLTATPLRPCMLFASRVMGKQIESWESGGASVGPEDDCVCAFVCVCVCLCVFFCCVQTL